jgi:hypothetical protein
VNIYYLIAKNTIDQIIWKKISEKLETIGETLDGVENTKWDLNSLLFDENMTKFKKIEFYFPKIDKNKPNGNNLY